MDFFLLAVTIVLSLLLLAANFYILALYCHKDDKGWGAATYCKVLVILGMTLCWAQVLMLPLDIANSQNDAGFDMITFWYVIMLIILGTIVLLLPFAMFMYETDEEKPFMSRVCTSLCFTLIEAVVVTLLLVISWIFFRYADIPLKISVSSNFVDSAQVITSSSIKQNTQNTTLTYEVSFPIYCIAFMTFLGWFLLVLFGGVGLSALPIDLIREFTMRPQLMSAKDAREKKTLIQKKVVELMDVGKNLKDDEIQVKNYDGGWWSKRKMRKDFETKENLLSVSVYELEREFDIFQLELRFSESTNKFFGPLIFFGKLILGVMFCFISLAIWVHILVYCVLDAHPFLNNMLTGLLKTPASFIATGIYAFIGLYILWCCQKGNLKVGIRIPFIMKIHPMKENETWMNSFLFNVITLLICSVAVTQFMVSAFNYYAYLTTIDGIINVQIQYMRWFRYFYEQKVFQIAFLCWSGLTFLILLIRRSDKPSELRELERLRNERRDIQKK